METHQVLASKYNKKREQFETTLKKIEDQKTQNNPKELTLIIGKTCNELHKESDKVRKQFNKQDLTVD